MSVLIVIALAVVFVIALTSVLLISVDRAASLADHTTMERILQRK